MIRASLIGSSQKATGHNRVGAPGTRIQGFQSIYSTSVITNKLPKGVAQ